MNSISWDRVVRVFSRILMVIILGSPVFLFNPADWAAVLAQSPGDVLLYEEDFEDGQAQGWNLEPGWQHTWIVNGDQHGVLSGEGHAFAVLQDPILGGQPFSLKFKFFRQSGAMHANLMSTWDASGFDRYGIGIGSDESYLYLNLFKQIDTPPDGSLAVSDAYIYNPAAWYQVEIVYDSGLIQVFLSKANIETPWLMLSYQDPDPLPPGQISFETLDGSAMLIDDVQVWGPPQAPPQPAPPQTAWITGFVVASATGANYAPLPGVEVSIFGAQNPFPAEGDFLGSAWTNADGFFSLEVPSGYEFYALRERNPDGYDSVEAASESGSPMSADWIELYGPLPAGGEFPENVFFDRPIPPEITVTPSPTATERRSAPFEYPQCPPGTELSLAEDFERGFSGQWELEPGWERVEGRLKGEEHRWATIAERAWLDPVIRFYLGFREGRNGLHVSIRMGDEGGSFSRYFFGLYENRVYLSKQYGDQFIPLRQAEANFDPSVWHPVEIFARGGDLRLSVDGQVWIDFHDDQPLGEGLVGLESLEESYVQIDALWVCAPGAELAPPPPKPVTDTPAPARRVTNTPRITRTRTPTPVSARVPPVVPPGGGDGGQRGPLDARFIILVGLLVIVSGAYLFFRGRGRPPERPRQPLPIPGLPPIRLINLWLTEGSTGTGKAVRADRPLRSGLPYSLHVQIQAREGETRSRAQAPTGDQQNLQVVYFSPPDQVRIEDPRGTMLLPTGGSSTIVSRVIVPQRAGEVRVRVGIYAGNSLLQSAVLDAGVMEKGRRKTARGRGIRRRVDYVAVSRYFDRAAQSQPLLSVLTNRAEDGSHWIGLYSIAADSPVQLRNGEVHTFSQLKLEQMGKQIRTALATVQGEKIYRLDYPLPPSGDTLQRRAQDLIDLAVNGYHLYDDLFLSHPGERSMERREGMHKLLGRPGLISIARCRADAASIPWSALYSFPIAVDQPAELKVCPDFLDQISRNQWDGGSRPVSVYDHLDDPRSCLDSPHCPLKGDLGYYTVCPFGFWGLMHSLEQPLQQVSPTPVDQVPAELQSPAWEQNARIEVKPANPVRCGMAAYTGIEGCEVHRATIASLRTPQEFALEYVQDLKRVRAMFKQAGWHLLYFFVHGVVDDKKKVFALKFGEPRRPALLSAAGLVPFPIPWSQQPHPLIILNGCETMALTPELVHGFMGKLRNLGASGIVGTEVKVWSDLARPLGEQLLEALLSGEAAGEALLRLRRNLQRQGNPLGLVYTLYAPAGLHLHRGDTCRCTAIQDAEVKPGVRRTQV